MRRCIAALLVFFMYALQCMSTVAVLRRESGSWKWPAVAFGYMFVLAWTLALGEAFEAGWRAFNLAEKYRTPVVILYDEIVGHMREPVALPETRNMAVALRTRTATIPTRYLVFISLSSC